MRVPNKPAFALLIGAVAFLAQDLFQRMTGIQVSADESTAFVTILAWLAYWLAPAELQK